MHIHVYVYVCVYVHINKGILYDDTVISSHEELNERSPSHVPPEPPVRSLVDTGFSSCSGEAYQERRALILNTLCGTTLKSMHELCR